MNGAHGTGNDHAYAANSCGADIVFVQPIECAMRRNGAHLVADFKPVGRARGIYALDLARHAIEAAPRGATSCKEFRRKRIIQSDGDDARVRSRLARSRATASKPARASASG